MSTVSENFWWSSRPFRQCLNFVTDPLTAVKIPLGTALTIYRKQEIFVKSSNYSTAQGLHYPLDNTGGSF